MDFEAFGVPAGSFGSTFVDSGAGYDVPALVMEGDRADLQAMQPFAPEGMPWWQALISYGATRAIDNRFGPPNVTGDTNPGTFAGQNGRTYKNNPTASGGSASAATGGTILGLPSWLVLLGAGAIAYALARD